jgi:hypothetical protein
VFFFSLANKEKELLNKIDFIFKENNLINFALKYLKTFNGFFYSKFFFFVNFFQDKKAIYVFPLIYAASFSSNTRSIFHELKSILLKACPIEISYP